jgi:hypothetical protein
MLDARYWILDAGYWLLDTGYSVLDVKDPWSKQIIDGSGFQEFGSRNAECGKWEKV